MSKIKIADSWLEHLKNEFEQEYMKNLKIFLKKQYDDKKIIYPPTEEYFAALNLLPLDQVKVVILGQDPYHGENQAHGLCFSVRKGVPLPPSLQNIFKELQSDLALPTPPSGDLTAWVKQGVLLLNSVLTVEKDKAASHQNQGWETFTDKIISVVNEQRPHVVFILWGSYAQKKARFVDRNRHFIIESAHPSPLSSYRGFFGSKPFSKTNTWLEKNGLTPINWSLT